MDINLSVLQEECTRSWLWAPGMQSSAIIKVCKHPFFRCFPNICPNNLTKTNRQLIKVGLRLKLRFVACLQDKSLEVKYKEIYQIYLRLNHCSGHTSSSTWGINKNGIRNQTYRPQLTHPNSVKKTPTKYILTASGIRQWVINFLFIEQEASSKILAPVFGLGISIVTCLK